MPIGRIPPLRQIVINIGVELIEPACRNPPLGQAFSQPHRILQWEFKTTKRVLETRLHGENVHTEVMTIASIVGSSLGKIREIGSWMVSTMIGGIQPICLAGPVARPRRSIQDHRLTRIINIVDQYRRISGDDVVRVQGADGEVIGIVSVVPVRTSWSTPWG